MDSRLDIIEQLRRKGLVHNAQQYAENLDLVPTGIYNLDRLCPGGLARGRISEIVTGGWGVCSVVFSVLAQATGQDASVALVDPSNGLDAVSASAHGVSLSMLLWVVPRGAKEAFRAAELILTTERFHTLVVDLTNVSSRSSIAAWMRMDRLARRSNTVVCVLSSSGVVGPFAHTLLGLRACSPVWRRGGDAENTTSPYWLADVEFDFEIRRRRSA